MREFLACLFFALFSLSAYSQKYIEKWDNDLKTDPRLSFSGIRYPLGVNGEVSKNLKIDYQISERLDVQSQHFYEKFGTHERASSSFLVKWYIKKNLYFFAGPESEFDINQETGKYELMRVNLSVGLGYEVSPKLLIELGYHAQTNKPTIETLGNPAKPNTFSLRASF